MADMPLGQPIPDDPSDPVGGDLHPEMSDEQIESALRDAESGRTVPVADDESAETQPTPEPAPAPAATDALGAEPAAVVPEVPQTAEERLAALESQIRVERLEREKAEAIAERERFLHSRNSGELGYLRKMLAERQTDSGADDPPADEPSRRTDLDEIRTEIHALKAERVQQGVAEELSNFQRAYPDAATDEQALTVIVQRKLPDYQEFLNGNDPKLARTMVRSLLKESYAELRIEREQATRASAATQSYDQADKMRARKIAAAPAASARTAPQRARPKSIGDLTDAELDALTDEHVRNSA